MKIFQVKIFYNWLFIGIISATLWLTVSTNYADYPTECPKIDPINYTIMLPHETECTKFYICSNGRKILMLCPWMDHEGNRLHFNSELHVCDYPEHANCQLQSTTTKETTDSTTVVMSSSTTGQPTSSTGTSMNPTTSTEIPTASTGVNTSTPSTTESSTSSTGSSTTEVPMTSTTQQSTNPASDMTSNPTDEIPSTTELPSTPSETTLSTTPNTIETTTEEIEMSTTVSSTFSLCTENPVQIYFPHESHPNLYYECSHGDLIRRECNGNTVFNVSEQTCVQPSKLNYILKLTNLPPGVDSISSSKTVTMCNADDSNGSCERFPHECDCTKYYVCSNGNAVLRACPSRLNFNPELKECDLPGNVDCSGDNNNPNNTIPTECPPENSGWAVHIAHETNCTLFYKCNWGKKVELPCKPGLYFNPKLQVCDYPCAAGCTAEGGNGTNTCHSPHHPDSKNSTEESISDDINSENFALINNK